MSAPIPGTVPQEQIAPAPAHPEQPIYEQQAPAPAAAAPAPVPAQHGAAPAAHGSAAGGVISDRDVAEWTDRFNAVLAKPSEVIHSASPAGAQSWHEAFFGCFSPIDLCCMTWCLPCVTFGKTHHRIRRDANLQGYEPINTSCLLMCGSSCVGLHWIPLAMQRADIRAKYNLEGNCLTDIAIACCCGCCQLVQDDKEAAYREPLVASGGHKEQYQPAGGMSYPAQQ